MFQNGMCNKLFFNLAFEQFQFKKQNTRLFEADNCNMMIIFHSQQIDIRQICVKVQLEHSSNLENVICKKKALGNTVNKGI